jgi:hypothetical protein
MPTAAEICIRAMKISGILAAGETPPADDINDVFDAFNVMVDSWSTERLFIYALQGNVFPLTAGQAAYTIGPDGLQDFTLARPQQISPGTFVRFTAQTLDYPVQLLTDIEYQTIQVKTAPGGFFFGLWYDPTFPNGTLNFWPVPPAGLNLHLYSWQPFGAAATLTTDVAFPPGYQRAFEYSLAEEIAPLFGQAIDPRVQQIAKKARRNVKRMNFPDQVMNVPADVLPTWFNGPFSGAAF